MKLFPAENTEKRGAFDAGIRFCDSLRYQRGKKKKYYVLKFPAENTEKRGAFDAGYSILRNSAKSAGQTK